MVYIYIASMYTTYTKLSFCLGQVLQKLQLLFQQRLGPFRDCFQSCRLSLQCRQLVCSSYSSLYVSQARKCTKEMGQIFFLQAKEWTL